MIPYAPLATDIFDGHDDGDSTWCSSDDGVSLDSSPSDDETELTVDDTAPEEDGLFIPALPIPADLADDLTNDGTSDASYEDWSSFSQSVYEDELSHGRRYHGFRKGRYPLPNDRQEQQREETNHAMMMELSVRIPSQVAGRYAGC